VNVCQRQVAYGQPYRPSSPKVVKQLVRSAARFRDKIDVNRDGCRAFGPASAVIRTNGRHEAKLSPLSSSPATKRVGNSRGDGLEDRRWPVASVVTSSAAPPVPHVLGYVVFELARRLRRPSILAIWRLADPAASHRVDGVCHGKKEHNEKREKDQASASQRDRWGNEPGPGQHHRAVPDNDEPHEIMARPAPITMSAPAGAKLDPDETTQAAGLPRRQYLVPISVAWALGAGRRIT
jgi:hypothetical protein